MQLTIGRPADVTTISLTGRFDAFEVDAFGQAVLDLIEASTTEICVDLSGVQFIDSSGLAELVRAMKRCRSVGGDLTLQAPSDAVRVILELTRLDSAFDIED